MKIYQQLLRLSMFLKWIAIINAVFFISFSAAAQPATTNTRSNPKELISGFFDLQAKVRYVYQTALNNTASAVAWCADGDKGQAIAVVSFLHPDRKINITASTSQEPCNETEPQWSPDGKEIAFLSDAQTKGQLQLFVADANTGTLLTQQPLTHLDGYVSHLHWSPNGKYLSVLYVEKATREPSPMAAEDRATGIIDSMVNNNVQHIAIVTRQTGETTIVTPKGLYIFEYDWSPDSKQFVYMAAVPPGDDNWYIAKMYKQPVYTTDTALIYKPAFQAALPRWSPDGKQIAFIEGLMSDQVEPVVRFTPSILQVTTRRTLPRTGLLHHRGLHGKKMVLCCSQNLLAAL